MQDDPEDVAVFPRGAEPIVRTHRLGASQGEASSEAS